MTLAGACRGASKQRLVAIGTVVGYSIGVPLAWFMGYHLEWPSPLLGVWYGNAIALGWAAVWVRLLIDCYCLFGFLSARTAVGCLHPGAPGRANAALPPCVGA